MTLEYPTNEQLLAYESFTRENSPENALRFILSCYKYIVIKAFKWRLPGVRRRDKIFDIMAEMYLVLLEDFCGCKSEACKSALAYLDLKIKRLINPGRKHIFSDIDEVLPESFSTVDSLTYEKLSMIDEIVSAVRRLCVLNCDSNNGLVPFLFIHIFPQIRWISEIMASKEKIAAEQRYEADVKRIKRFNAKLRESFNFIKSGDWREILNWGTLERRHLAYKITTISPKEIFADTTDDLEKLDNWRDNFDVSQKQDCEKLGNAEKVLLSMNRHFSEKGDANVVSEEALPWGTVPDILSMLLGKVVVDKGFVTEEAGGYAGFGNNPESDSEFMEVASELNKWFGNMLAERNKRALENRLNW